jgi:hypothetical protein
MSIAYLKIHRVEAVGAAKVGQKADRWRQMPSSLRLLWDAAIAHESSTKTNPHEQ